LPLLEKENFIDFCNFWKRKISLIFATFGKGKFHLFLQVLEKENSVGFSFWPSFHECSQKKLKGDINFPPKAAKSANSLFSDY
jgi:hypothetical protein